MNWDIEVDFLVVGSGGGGLTAAITAHELGLKSLVIEKSSKYGGTTALSGGVIWIPNNHHMGKAGIQDSREDAIKYLKQVVSDDVPEERLLAYVDQGPEMLKFLEEHSLLQYDPAPYYPDYYSELEGGKPGARSLDPRPYSIRKLGLELFKDLKLSSLKNSNGFSMTAAEAHVLFGFTWRSNLILFKRLLSFWLDIPTRLKKLPDNRLTLGKALISRLRHSMYHKGIELMLNTPASELIVEDGRVMGVVSNTDQGSVRIKANKGVLLASGGFAHSEELRAKYHPEPQGSLWSAASQDDTGDAITMGQAHGANIDMMGYAWWSPTMVMPNGTVEALIVGKSMPGCMVVNKSGERFCNEAEPYEDFVKSQFRANKSCPSIPAYFVFDSRYRYEYPMGQALAPAKYLPDATAKDLFDCGWIKKADTLEELAALCGIDATGLIESASKLEKFAQSGVDEDFGKGKTLIDRYYSDHRISPNPCLAAVQKPPFYAVQVWPGDLGTKGGLVADEFARVHNEQGVPIPGLYVTGNASASVMGNSYPGAGSTIGPSMTFGYIAAKHAAGKLD